MLSDIKIINPVDLLNWDEMILQHPEYSFFHSSYWSKVLQDTYNYKPYYFVIEKNNELCAAIPVMFVESFITGKRAVSLPFSDYCQPLISDGINFDELFNEIINVGKSEGLKYLELRGGNKFLPDGKRSAFDYIHNLDISLVEESLFNNFNSSTKRNIKKAKREGVAVEISSSKSTLKDFYVMNCITRKRQGVPPQPMKFFDNLYKYVLSRNHGFIAIAKYNNMSISGAVFLHIGNKALYKFGASLMQYQNLRANNLVMWEALKYYSSRGFESFSFGKTKPDNEGLRKFKLGWGTTEEIVNVYKYSLKKNNFIQSNSNSVGFYNHLFKRMPLIILNFIGKIIYRHAA